MSTESPYKALMVAEEIVDRYGSPDMFKNSYTMARQYFSVLESIEMALKQQTYRNINLWDIFVSRG